MNETKWVPLGVENYKEVASTCYYVDKTRLIAYVCDAPKGSAFLFTRPRRFGKSLAISMLDYFFSDEENSLTLFEPFKIAKAKDGAYLKAMNQSPVIHLSLKNIDADDFDGLLRSLSIAMAELYDHFLLKDLPNLSQNSSAYIEEILSKRPSLESLSDSLKKLCGFVHLKKGRPPVVLLDEYDAPVLSALEHGYAPNAVAFFKNFLGAALKGNDDLERAVITGVLEIAKDSIFSGLNNLITDNGFESDEEYFAFSYSEVVSLLSYYEASADMAEIESWYGGYRFSGKPAFCPWSILSFVKKGLRYRPYWSATSSNRILAYADASLAAEPLSKLLSGESVTIPLRESLSFDSLGEEASFLSLLLYSGYLRAEAGLFQGQCKLSIPNQEAKIALREDVLKTYGNRQFAVLSDLRDAFLCGDSKRISSLVHDYILSALSYWDFGSEQVYATIIMTLTALLFDEAEVRRERNMGEGRCDLSIISKKDRGFAIILEFKRLGAKSRNDALESKAKEALAQIEEKNYAESAKSQGKSPIVLLGIAFAGKRVAVESKTLE